MANTSSPTRRTGGGCRRCARGELLAAALAAMLCSASYCLSIWHNSRGAANSSVLGPSASGVGVGVGAGATSCGSADNEELDFESHHSADNAGLSVSAPAARRALRAAAGYRGPFPWPASRAVAWAANSARGAEAAAGEGRARVVGDKPRSRAYAAAVFRLVPVRPRTALDVSAMLVGGQNKERAAWEDRQ